MTRLLTCTTLTLALKCSEIIINMQTLKSDMDKFLLSSTRPREVDSLKWWEINRSIFTELGTVVNKMQYSSSVESERLFSVGENIYTPHRSQLMPATGEKLMLLNFILPILNFNYKKLNRSNSNVY